MCSSVFKTSGQKSALKTWSFFNGPDHNWLIAFPNSVAFQVRQMCLVFFLVKKNRDCLTLFANRNKKFVILSHVLLVTWKIPSNFSVKLRDVLQDTLSYHWRVFEEVMLLECNWEQADTLFSYSSCGWARSSNLQLISISNIGSKENAGLLQTRQPGFFRSIPAGQLLAK